MFIAMRRNTRAVVYAVLLTMGLAGLVAAHAQSASQKVFYFPKPIQPSPYVAPMKPWVRLSALKAKHKGEANWSQLVVSNDYNRVEVISAAPGSKVPAYLLADSTEYWFVEQGEIRFQIDDPPGQAHTIDAKPGTLVFAPQRMLRSLEVIGTEPAIRVQITLAEATPIYPSKPQEPQAGKHFIPVTVWTYPNPDEVPNPGGKPDQLSFPLDAMLKAHEGKRGWSDLAIMRNRAHANIICSQAIDAKPRPGDLGHFHDFPETWIVMRGQLRWTIEGVTPFVAEEGDIVYAPSTRWHLIEPYGSGTACRLAMTPFPDGNHLYQPRPAK